MYWVSIKDLRAKCQNTNYGYDDYPLMFRFIRVISIYFTWLIIQTKCKPNTITILGIIFGVLSGVTFYSGFVGLALVLTALSIIADFSDGEVSRFQGTASKEGTYLDHIHHFVVQPFVIAGIVLWSFEKTNDHLFLAAGMVSVINSIIQTLVVTAAVDLALLKHLLRHLKSNNTIGNSIKNSPTVKSQRQNAKFHRKIPGALARFMDFPYVIIIMGLTAALVSFSNSSVLAIDHSFLRYLIYAYAFLSTSTICVFVWNVVHSKHIEKRLDELKKMLQ